MQHRNGWATTLTDQVPVATSDKTSYCKISWSLEVGRLVVEIIVSICNWEAHRQHCCRGACWISERSHISRIFDSLRDLTIRRLIWILKRVLYGDCIWKKALLGPFTLGYRWLGYMEYMWFLTARNDNNQPRSYGMINEYILFLCTYIILLWMPLSTTLSDIIWNVWHGYSQECAQSVNHRFSYLSSRPGFLSKTLFDKRRLLKKQSHCRWFVKHDCLCDHNRIKFSTNRRAVWFI